MKILCLTVFPDEFLALQRAIHHPWQETLTPCGTPYLATNYNGLQLALVHLSAKSLANPQRLISLGDHLKPQLIVMVGICRGNPAKVVLGDIIVAQKIFTLPTANRTSDSAYILAQPWQGRLLGNLALGNSKSKRRVLNQACTSGAGYSTLSTTTNSSLTIAPHPRPTLSAATTALTGL